MARPRVRIGELRHRLPLPAERAASDRCRGPSDGRVGPGGGCDNDGYGQESRESPH